MKLTRNYWFHFMVGLALTAMPVIGTAQGGTSSAQSRSSQQERSSATTSTEKSQSSTQLSAADKHFVREAAQGGLAEVELGKMATEKASSQEVKKFGQRMVDDHTKANEQLKQVASKEGIQLPGTLNAKDLALKERLSKLSGAEFDKAYMENMVKDHRKDVADFELESKNGRDKEVKQFASSTLQTLKSHLQEAEQIQPQTKAENKSPMK